jgi:hypothetical protein
MADRKKTKTKTKAKRKVSSGVAHVVSSLIVIIVLLNDETT